MGAATSDLEQDIPTLRELLLSELVLKDFSNTLSKTKYFVGHNILFDLNIIFTEFYRLNEVYLIEKDVDFYCVMRDEDLIALFVRNMCILEWGSLENRPEASRWAVACGEEASQVVIECPET